MLAVPAGTVIHPAPSAWARCIRGPFASLPTPQRGLHCGRTCDVSRAVPVVSLAFGRMVDLRVRLGDKVRQGQLLMRIKSADISQARSDYRKAVTSEILVRAQLERAKVLFERGAIAEKDLEVGYRFNLPARTAQRETSLAAAPWLRRTGYRPGADSSHRPLVQRANRPGSLRTGTMAPSEYECPFSSRHTEAPLTDAAAASSSREISARWIPSASRPLVAAGLGVIVLWAPFANRTDWRPIKT